MLSQRIIIKLNNINIRNNIDFFIVKSSECNGMNRCHGDRMVSVTTNGMKITKIQSTEKLGAAVGRFPMFVRFGMMTADSPSVLRFRGRRDGGPVSRRRSARASPLIRLLRAHGLVRKVSGRNWYMVTEYGYELSTAIALAENVSVRKLGEKAA